jgi:hypothetical protein
MFSLHLGGRCHPPVTAWVTLLFVLGKGLNLATPADLWNEISVGTLPRRMQSPEQGIRGRPWLTASQL